MTLLLLILARTMMIIIQRNQITASKLNMCLGDQEYLTSSRFLGTVTSNPIQTKVATTTTTTERSTVRTNTAKITNTILMMIMIIIVRNVVTVQLKNKYKHFLEYHKKINIRHHTVPFKFHHMVQCNHKNHV